MATQAEYQDYVNQHIRQVMRMLDLPMDSIPKVKVVVGDLAPGNENALAQGIDYTITVTKDYLKTGNPRDFEGSAIHELVHALTVGMPGGVVPGTPAYDQVEPIADAVRYHITGNDGGWVPTGDAERISHLKPWQIGVLQQSMQSGDYKPRLIDALENGDIKRGDVEALGRYGAVVGGPNTDAPPNVRDTDQDGIPDRDEGAGDRGGSPWDEDPTGDGDPEKDSEYRNYASAAREQLVSLGIPITDAMTELIHNAGARTWTTDTFMTHLRGTEEYQARFPGISNADGTLKMSEADYIASEKMYSAYASSAGINMSGKRMAYLFRNDVTPQEFADRATAMHRLSTNKDLYSAFKRELVQGGVAKPGEVNSNKELFKFLMGEGNKAYADLWQDTITKYQANQAGITIAKNKESYTNIAQKAIEHISSLGLSEEEMGQRFSELSSALATVLPLQEADLYGIGKNTLTKAVFGGKGSERARGKVQRAVDTDEAFYDQRANPQAYSDQKGGVITQGVTDQSRKSKSEY